MYCFIDWYGKLQVALPTNSSRLKNIDIIEPPIILPNGLLYPQLEKQSKISGILQLLQISTNLAEP